MSGKKLTTKQVVILFIATTADFIWMIAPAWVVLFGAIILGPVDGALGKQYGFFLTIALAISVYMLWAPIAQSISTPLIQKLAKRIGATGDKRR